MHARVCGVCVHRGRPNNDGKNTLKLNFRARHICVFNERGPSVWPSILKIIIIKSFIHNYKTSRAFHHEHSGKLKKKKARNCV